MSSNPTLQTIRTKVKAPKSQYNDFGHYHYRTKETILESIKPLLDECKALLEFRDTPVTVGADTFMQSEARLSIPGDEHIYHAFGYALHAKELKGMQPAQVTGATTSYAQKAALEALFLIDSATNIDDMKPTVTITKDSSRPPVASGAAKKSNWLNLGTKEYTEALNDLKFGKTTLDKIKLKYSVARATEAQLISDFNTK